MEMIARSQNEVDDRETTRAKEHERATSPAVDSKEGYDSKDYIGHTCYDNIEQHIAYAIACG